MVGAEVGFAVVPKLTIGLETAGSRVTFGPPIDDTVGTNWTGVAVTYRF